MTMRQVSKIQDEKASFLSGRTDNLELHHCLNGTHQRKKCDQDGLVVWLTHDEHWNLHNTIEGKEKKRWLKQVAQEVYEQDHTREEFIKRYGKSYL